MSSSKKYKYKNECISRFSRRKEEATDRKNVKKKINHAKYEAIVWDISDEINDAREVESEAEWEFIECNHALVQGLEESLEDSGDIPSIVAEKCKILHDGVKRLAKVNKIEIQELKTVVERNPKYFCVSCITDLCKDCLSSVCITHEVLWMGNRLFRCSSPYHVNKQ